MKNNLVYFRDHYPELGPIIDIHFDDWEKEYGDLPLLDIATSKADAISRKEHYLTMGYQLEDEDYIGLGFNKIAILQCYVSNTNKQQQPEYKRIKVVRILLRKHKDSKILMAICLNDNNLWELPSYYITKGMHVPTKNIVEVADMEDEYVYYHMETNNIHGARPYQWRTLESMAECTSMTGSQLQNIIKVYGAVLDWIQYAPDKNRVEYYYNLYKILHHEMAKRKYIETLDFYLSGQSPIVLDGTYYPAKTELLRKERQTLAHFHPIEFLPSANRTYGFYNDKLSSYSCYCPLDITQFGGRIILINHPR